VSHTSTPRLRTIILWITLLGIALPAVMSILGAFMGAQRASALFNSPPMAAFWVLLTLLLVAGLIFFKKLRRSAGLLMTHLGCVFVLVGSMIASDTGHRYMAPLLGREKLPSALMVITQGDSTDALLAMTDADGPREVGRLPFQIHLSDFRIDYYDPWLLVVDTPSAEDDPAGDAHAPSTIAWSLGRPAEIPHTDVRLQVLRYLEGSRPVFLLEITHRDGPTLTLPAEVGRETVLGSSGVKVRILRVFSHLRVEGSGSDIRVVDVPGWSENPALQVELTHPDGKTERQYVIPGFPVDHVRDSPIDLRYLTTSDPVAAEPDSASSLPAMELLLKRGDVEVRRWLIVEEGEPFATLPLDDLFPPAQGAPPRPDHPHGRSAHAALYLVPPMGPIKDYKSDLVVLEEGREVARKTIEVNDPLHYGGYHFYQLSYDQEHERYTVLSVRSDSGLLAVYAGFLLLAVGVFWLFWVKPALASAERRTDDGD